jgi:hypothetical protein
MCAIGVVPWESIKGYFEGISEVLKKVIEATFKNDFISI